MLISFSVRNFKSILDTAELSMIAVGDLDNTCASTLIKGSGFNLNSLGIIFGANGSGKTSLLEAFRYFESFFNRYDTLKNPPVNFMAADQPTELGLVFFSGGLFDVHLTVFGGKAECKFRAYRENSWETVRTISMCPFEEFQKCLFISRESTEVRSLIAFFRQVMFYDSMDDLFENSDINGELSDIVGKSTVDVVSSQDNPARNVFFFDGPDITVKRSLFQEILKQVGIDIKGVEYKRISNIVSGDGGKKSVSILIPKNLVYQNYSVPLEDESAGTKRLVKLAHTLALGLTMKRCVFMIDELDAGLHDVLASEIIRIVIKKNGDSPKINSDSPLAQMIFTTHNTVLLKDELIRRDQLWFTEMNEKRTTELFSLSDLDGVSTENYEEHYLKGDYGALPPIEKWYVTGGRKDD